MGEYGYSFLIYRDKVWLTKDGITTAVTIKKPKTFTGSTYASRYAYDDKMKRYSETKKHQKGVVQKIKYIPPEPVFLDLCNN